MGMQDLAKTVNSKFQSLKRQFKSFEANNGGGGRNASMQHLRRGNGPGMQKPLRPAKNTMPMSKARKKNKAK